MNTTIPISTVQTTSSGSPAADSNFRSQVSPGSRQGHAFPSSFHPPPSCFQAFFFFFAHHHLASWTTHQNCPFEIRKGSRNQKSSCAVPARGREGTAFEALSSFLNPLLNTHPLTGAGSPPHYPCPSAGGRWNSWLSISLPVMRLPLGAANTNQAGSRLPALQAMPATSCLPSFS